MLRNVTTILFAARIRPSDQTPVVAYDLVDLPATGPVVTLWLGMRTILRQHRTCFDNRVL